MMLKSMILLTVACQILLYLSTLTVKSRRLYRAHKSSKGPCDPPGIWARCKPSPNGQPGLPLMDNLTLLDNPALCVLCVSRIVSGTTQSFVWMLSAKNRVLWSVTFWRQSSRCDKKTHPVATSRRIMKVTSWCVDSFFISNQNCFFFFFSGLILLLASNFAK